MREAIPYNELLEAYRQASYSDSPKKDGQS